MAKLKYLQNYIVDSKTGCWIWTKTLTHDGYAKCTFLGKDHRASRLFYETFIGEIPKRLVIDHLCRNHACVNPEHLEAVTGKENVRRGKLTKLKATDHEIIRTLYKQARFNQNELADLYSVTQSVISRIVHFKRGYTTG